MLNMQETLDIMGDLLRQERSRYHLTLGGLIAFLEKTNPDFFVEFDIGGKPGWPHSYRGYYSDLAFTPIPRESILNVSVRGLLQTVKQALDIEFDGYKGGEFLMDEKTPLWCASYGNNGRAIVGIALDVPPDLSLILLTKELD